MCPSTRTEIQNASMPNSVGERLHHDRVSVEKGKSEHSTEHKSAADGGQMPWTGEEIGHILELFSSPPLSFFPSHDEHYWKLLVITHSWLQDCRVILVIWAWSHTWQHLGTNICSACENFQYLRKQRLASSGHVHTSRYTQEDESGECCLLCYEGKKKEIKVSPYKINFDLHLSLNPDVSDLLRICWWMRIESFICQFCRRLSHF